VSGVRHIVATVSVGGSWSGGKQFDRIAAGGLASSTETRLRELARWNGFSSFFTPPGFVVGESAGVHPVAQVVGLAAGELRPGYVPVSDRWKLRVEPASRRDSEGAVVAFGGARWQEHPQIVRGWNELRRLALGRLVKQAAQLDCQVVVGIEPRRDFDLRGEGGLGDAVLQFTGTAVRVDGWHGPASKPVLTLAGVVEVASMLSRGIEPVGIAGGVGRIECRPGEITVRASRRRGFRTPSIELEDLTQSVYEARRSAMKALRSEAAKLDATGVVDVRLELEREGAATQLFGSVVFTAHALGSVVRRIGSSTPKGSSARPVVGLARRSDV
jgi:uncharacterized protein YbjQ (UPF0145 family)